MAHLFWASMLAKRRSSPLASGSVRPWVRSKRRNSRFTAPAGSPRRWPSRMREVSQTRAPSPSHSAPPPWPEDQQKALSSRDSSDSLEAANPGQRPELS